MTWDIEGIDEGNSVTFTAWRCGRCRRRIITTGYPPQQPCSCEAKHQIRRGGRR